MLYLVVVAADKRRAAQAQARLAWLNLPTLRVPTRAAALPELRRQGVDWQAACVVDERATPTLAASTKRLRRITAVAQARGLTLVHLDGWPAGRPLGAAGEDIHSPPPPLWQCGAATLHVRHSPHHRACGWACPPLFARRRPPLVLGHGLRALWAVSIGLPALQLDTVETFWRDLAALHIAHPPTWSLHIILVCNVIFWCIWVGMWLAHR